MQFIYWPSRTGHEVTKTDGLYLGHMLNLLFQIYIIISLLIYTM